MAHSQETRPDRGPGDDSHLFDAFDLTSDFMMMIEPGTGLVVKGLGRLMRFVSRKADEEARQRRS